MRSPEAHAVYMRSYRRRKPDVMRAVDGRKYARAKADGSYYDQYLRRHFGIDLERYDQMLAAQHGLCAVCQRPETSRGGELRLAVDHDHLCCPGPKSCGRCVRGLLCDKCNRALGLLQDDPSRIAAALEYLTRTGVPA